MVYSYTGKHEEAEVTKYLLIINLLLTPICAFSMDKVLIKKCRGFYDEPNRLVYDLSGIVLDETETHYMIKGISGISGTVEIHQVKKVSCINVDNSFRRVVEKKIVKEISPSEVMVDEEKELVFDNIGHTPFEKKIVSIEKVEIEKNKQPILSSSPQSVKVAKRKIVPPTRSKSLSRTQFLKNIISGRDFE